MKYQPGAASNYRWERRGSTIGFLCLVMIFTVDVVCSSAQNQANRVTTASTPSLAPSPSPTPDDQGVADPAATSKTKKEKRGSLVIAPIPIVSPAFGSGAIIAAAYVFRLNTRDEVSPASTVGLLTAFTNNGTRGLIMGGRLFLAENKYQTRFAIGKGRANYEFFGIGRLPDSAGVSVLVKQSGTFVFGEFMRNVGKDLFVGPRVQYRKLSAGLGGETTPGGFEIPEIDLKSTTSAIGFRVLHDTTGSGYYPRKGGIFSFTGDFFGKAIGSDRTYQAYKASYNRYKSLGEKQVLAYRAMACSSSTDAPFYDLCLFGSNDLRGYTTGQFLDHRMFATQVEYRRELPYRLGVVGFAGVGTVAPSWSKMRFDNLLPAAGFGLRFKLDKKNHINYRIDLGFGRSGHTLSMSVTEAF